ncbi:MAG: hypothetical protein HDR07_12770 [Lachnospiraceae bacterium]|nr:hypothetical protein [Lachnospiraceae bacterium]
MNTIEQIHLSDLERLRSLRYMDDDFMTICLADNFEGVELILRILLERKDIKIRSIRTQEPMKNLQGCSVVLDVHAVDSTDREFDVEIQRSDAGAGAKRARYFKQDREGVANMSKILDDMRNEKAKEVRIENAIRMIKDKELSLEKIALYSGLSIEEVRELATPVMA